MSKREKRETRLTQLERQTPIERQFVEWVGNPWTEEQKAEAIRREPNRRIFFRSLSESIQDETDTQQS
jgi:hypothetical protein